MKVRGAWLAIVAFGLIPIGLARAEYWQGTVSLDEHQFGVGVLLEGDGSSATLKVDSPSMHLPLTEVEEFERSGSGLSFVFPNDLGSFDLRFDGPGLVGSTRLEDGRTGAVELRPSDPPAIVTEGYDFENGEVKLGATLCLPAGDGPFPALAMPHGGGNSTRESSGYWFWMEFMARNGIAVLGWDKRGNGESGGDWREVGLGPLAQDVAIAADKLAADPRIDAGAIGVLGISQGGWIGTMAAVLNPEIDHLVIVSGPAVSPLRSDQYATMRTFGDPERTPGLTPEERRLNMDMWMRLTTATYDPEMLAWYTEAWERAKEAEWFQTYPWNGPEGFDQRWYPKWYAKISRFDPLPVLRQLDAPILWVYGGDDSLSALPESLELRGRLQQDMDKPYMISVFPNAGHGVNFPTGREGEGPYITAPMLFETVLGWLEARARGSAAAQPHR